MTFSAPRRFGTVVGRRGAAVAWAVVVVAALAGCIGSDPSDDPPDHPSGLPSGPTGPGADLALADARFSVGPPELVMGPSTYVDSPLNGVKIGDTVRGYVGNVETVLLEGSSAADLEPTDQVVVGRGDTKARFDWCGAWLDAVEPDPDDPDLLRAWYHAEADCAYANNQTHKSIAYAESRDGGRTFTKPGYPDNQVVRSPTGGADGFHTGRGAPSVIRRGDHYFMYYLNVLPDLSTVTSVARAPVSSGGVPGSWRNYAGGDWSSSALDGPAAPLNTTVPASSASLHTPSDEVMLVRQHAPRGGIVLQASKDGLHFTELPEPLVPYLASQVRTDWGSGTEGQVIGYVSAVGPDGSRSWTDEFYLFHMYVFPGDELRGGRYLVRRKVTVEEAPADGPWSLVALSSYVDASGDRYATSAPEKSAASDEVLGHLLSTPAADRLALFECRSSGGDRFVGAACGATAERERLVGYSFAAGQEDTAGLYRCATTAGDQYASFDVGCEGGRKVSDLGYVYPASS